MTETTPPDAEALHRQCGSVLAELAESFNLCFDRTCRLELAGEGPDTWSLTDLQAQHRADGLLIALRVGRQGILCLIPESLQLPGWYRVPESRHESRLQTLALEWATNLLPEGCEADDYVSLAVPQLDLEVDGSRPADGAAVVTLNVFDEQAGASDQTIGSILIISPVDSPPFPREEKFASHPEMFVDAGEPAIDEARLRRIAGLPVEISVRLAEKRISVGQLLAMSPGSLITFSRSCEDLLDLYVNNHRYCLGEAVKIGEKFGLKITEVNPEPVQKQSVIHD